MVLALAANLAVLMKDPECILQSVISACERDISNLSCLDLLTNLDQSRGSFYFHPENINVSMISVTTIRIMTSVRPRPWRRQ